MFGRKLLACASNEARGSLWQSMRCSHPQVLIAQRGQLPRANALPRWRAASVLGRQLALLLRGARFPRCPPEYLEGATGGQSDST